MTQFLTRRRPRTRPPGTGTLDGLGLDGVGTNGLGRGRPGTAGREAAAPDVPVAEATDALVRQALGVVRRHLRMEAAFVLEVDGGPEASTRAVDTDDPCCGGR